MISAKASFFARRSGSVIGAGLPGRRARARRPRLAVAPQHRFEVEVLVARVDLETDARRAVAIDQEPTAPKHTVHQVDRGAVEHDQVHPPAETRFERRREVVVEALQGPGRFLLEQDREIDVAGGPRRTTGRAAEQIRRCQPWHPTQDLACPIQIVAS